MSENLKLNKPFLMTKMQVHTGNDKYFHINVTKNVPYVSYFCVQNGQYIYTAEFKHYHFEFILVLFETSNNTSFMTLDLLKNKNKKLTILPKRAN